MDLLEDLVCSVIAGRVTQAQGRHRSRVEVTLTDGTAELSAVYDGLRGLLLRGKWPAERQAYVPYQ